ncbi:MAG: EF-hand domain-containing protein [Pseudomonadota bacterium]
MNRLNLLTCSAAAITVIGVGFAVTAAQNGPVPQMKPSAGAEITRADHREKRGGRHGRSHRGGGEILRNIFDAADTDNDGAVTQAEIDAYRAARLAEVDISGDGALSIAEFDTLYRDLTRPRMVDAFQKIDANGDGQIAPDEIDRSVARLVERLDRDGDGELTLERRRRAAPEE